MTATKEEVHMCVSVFTVTISEDVYVAAEKVTQHLLQLAATQFSLQGGADGLLSPLDHQH